MKIDVQNYAGAPDIPQRFVPRDVRYDVANRLYHKLCDRLVSSADSRGIREVASMTLNLQTLRGMATAIVAVEDDR